MSEKRLKDLDLPKLREGIFNDDFLLYLERLGDPKYDGEYLDDLERLGWLYVGFGRLIGLETLKIDGDE